LRRDPPTNWAERQSGYHEDDPDALPEIRRGHYQREREQADESAPLAFVSYVHEDSAAVDRLCRLLNEEGVKTWRDRDDLAPGDRWKTAIQEAIRQHAMAFIACFSRTYTGRHRSYMNEELTIAVEEARLRPRDRAWLFPVPLDACEIPALALGAGEDLRDLQTTFRYQDPRRETARLADAIKQLAQRP
jgi:TIR domain